MTLRGCSPLPGGEGSGVGYTVSVEPPSQPFPIGEGLFAARYYGCWVTRIIEVSYPSAAVRAIKASTLALPGAASRLRIHR